MTKSTACDWYRGSALIVCKAACLGRLTRKHDYCGCLGIASTTCLVVAFRVTPHTEFVLRTRHEACDAISLQGCNAPEHSAYQHLVEPRSACL
jgi:hypothetical protein